MADETTLEIVLSSQSVIGAPIIETVTVIGTVPVGPRGMTGPTGATGASGAAGATGPEGDPGPGVAEGGTTGQVLAKASDDDYDTEWVEQSGGGGGGTVETVVAGAGVSVDSTDPANPVVTAQVTQAELDAEASTRGAADTALDGRLDTLEAISIATDAELAAEAALARNADNLTSGTVADARIASTIARDSEVTAAVSASEAGQVRDGDAAGGVLSDTYPNPGFAVDMATQAELDAVAAAKQPLDADLTALAAAGNSGVLAATTASFTTADETKLDGIEAGADVTDATNVSAAGAQMVYVHSAGSYALAAGRRVFYGSEDPTADGFTMATGDEWVDPT